MNQEEIKTLRATLDNMNDYEKMEIGIAPIGTVNYLNKIMYGENGYQQRVSKQAETIAQQADQIKQLRIEADFNFEQYQDAGRLMFELKEITEQQAEAIRLKDVALIAVRDDLEIRMRIAEDDSLNISNSVLDQMCDAIDLQPSPEILQARDEPVAYLDANYGFMRCGNAADHLPIGTKLYAVPPQPAPSVPEGYQLVPIEPTEAMQEAWDGESSLMGTWNAMLAAARSE